MAQLINEGSHVCELFAGTFETIMNANARASEFVRYTLNVQDGLSVTFSCMTGSARKYLAFGDALRAELRKHDIALVFAYDYTNASKDETNVYVICSEN